MTVPHVTRSLTHLTDGLRPLPRSKHIFYDARLDQLARVAQQRHISWPSEEQRPTATSTMLHSSALPKLSEWTNTRVGGWKVPVSRPSRDISRCPSLAA
jgi:hypothetical protein